MKISHQPEPLRIAGFVLVVAALLLIPVRSPVAQSQEPQNLRLKFNNSKTDCKHSRRPSRHSRPNLRRLKMPRSLPPRERQVKRLLPRRTLHHQPPGRPQLRAFPERRLTQRVRALFKSTALPCSTWVTSSSKQTRTGLTRFGRSSCHRPQTNSRRMEISIPV